MHASNCIYSQRYLQIIQYIKLQHMLSMIHIKKQYKNRVAYKATKQKELNKHNTPTPAPQILNHGNHCCGKNQKDIHEEFNFDLLQFPSVQYYHAIQTKLLGIRYGKCVLVKE